MAHCTPGAPLAQADHVHLSQGSTGSPHCNLFLRTAHQTSSHPPRRPGQGTPRSLSPAAATAVGQGRPPRAGLSPCGRFVHSGPRSVPLSLRVGFRGCCPRALALPEAPAGGTPAGRPALLDSLGGGPGSSGGPSRSAAWIRERAGWDAGASECGARSPGVPAHSGHTPEPRAPAASYPRRRVLPFEAPPAHRRGEGAAPTNWGARPAALRSPLGAAAPGTVRSAGSPAFRELAARRGPRTPGSSPPPSPAASGAPPWGPGSASGCCCCPPPFCSTRSTAGPLRRVAVLALAVANVTAME